MVIKYKLFDKIKLQPFISVATTYNAHHILLLIIPHFLQNEGPFKITFRIFNINFNILNDVATTL